MGQLTLVVDPNSINKAKMQQLVDQFNSLSGAKEFLNIKKSSLSGTVYITDKRRRRMSSPGRGG